MVPPRARLSKLWVCWGQVCDIPEMVRQEAVTFHIPTTSPPQATGVAQVPPPLPPQPPTRSSIARPATAARVFIFESRRFMSAASVRLPVIASDVDHERRFPLNGASTA